MIDKTVIKTIRFAFFIVVHTELMMQRNAETHKKAHGYDRAESVYWWEGAVLTTVIVSPNGRY